MERACPAKRRIGLGPMTATEVRRAYSPNRTGQRQHMTTRTEPIEDQLASAGASIDDHWNFRAKAMVDADHRIPPRVRCPAALQRDSGGSAGVSDRATRNPTKSMR